MAKWMQRWQFASQAEQSLGAELDTCQQYGFDGLIAKALDGQWWMGQGIDNNPDALASVEQVAQQAQAARDRGLQFGVWINPRQAAMGDDMAALVAAIASVCDGVAFDTEPYDGFLGAWPPAGLCQGFMEGIRNKLSPGSRLIWQPDPRPNALAAVRQDEWGPYMDVYAPQDYVSDFYFTPTADLMAALLSNTRNVAAQYNLEPWTTLPGNASPDVLPTDAIQLMAGYVVWRMGSTPPGNLSYIGGIQMAQPADPCTEIAADRDKYQLFMHDIAYRIGDVIQAEGSRKGGPRKAQILAAVQAMYSEAEQADGHPRAASKHARLPVSAEMRAEPRGNVLEGSNDPPR